MLFWHSGFDICLFLKVTTKVDEMEPILAAFRARLQWPLGDAKEKNMRMVVSK